MQSDAHVLPPLRPTRLLAATRFLYPRVPGLDLPGLNEIGRRKRRERRERRERLPVVLAHGEVGRVLTIRTVQELPGHSDVSTAMIHTHVLKLGGVAPEPVPAAPAWVR